MTTADGRVEEHMRLVDECRKRLQEWHEFRLKADHIEYDAARKAVEQSARALLSASQGDADTKRVEWMFAHRETGADEMTFENSDAWRAWVDAAMKETK